MIEYALSGAMIRIVVELWHRCVIKDEPCLHDRRLILHSQNTSYCYTCRKELDLDVSYYPRHQR